MPALPPQYRYGDVQVLYLGWEVKAGRIVDVAFSNAELVSGVGGAGAVAGGHRESGGLEYSQHGGHDAVQVSGAGERHQVGDLLLYFGKACGVVGQEFISRLVGFPRVALLAGGDEVGDDGGPVFGLGYDVVQSQRVIVGGESVAVLALPVVAGEDVVS